MTRVVALAALVSASLTIAAQQPAPTVAGDPAVIPYAVSTVRESNGTRPPEALVGVGVYQASSMPLSTLIQYAYNLQKTQVVGGPAWLDSKIFDIDAKSDEADNAVPRSLTRELQSKYDSRQVQILLTDRFHLTMHTEQREIPVYGLVIAKGGPKMRSSDGKSSLESLGVRDLPNSDWPGIRGVDRGRLIGIKTGMDRLASLLAFYDAADLDRPVVNMTGLTGLYDFQLEWTPGMTSDQSAPSRPGLFTAITEQLGLKLEPRKHLMEVLVIDHAEMPTEN